MPTVIDSLVVVLGLDPTQFTAGQKRAAESLRRTEAEASRAGKNIEASGGHAAEFFGQMRNQALALFAVFTGGRGLKEFAVSTTNVAAATGRLAHNLSLSTTELSAWQIAASQFAGGSAAATAASLTNLSQALTSAALTGTSGLPQFFRILGVRLTDAHNKARSLNDILLDVAGSKKFQSMTPAQQVFFGHQIGLDDGTINLLQQGRAAVEAALAKARQQGTINKEQAETFQKLQTAAVGASTALDALGRLILEKLAPTIIAVLDAISKTKPIVDGAKKIFDPNSYHMGPVPPTPPAVAAVRDWWKSHMPTALGGEQPRGIRNNNPLNLTYLPGQGATGSDGRFGVYASMPEGVAAAYRQLLLYQSRGNNTVRGIVTKWAPPGENDTAAYIQQVARDLNVSPDAALNLNDPKVAHTLIASMSRHENSKIIGGAAIDAGIGLVNGTQSLPTAAPANDFSSVDTILNGIRASRGDDVTNNAGAHTETHIGQITVNTKATDAKGIAAGIGGALRSNPLVPQANTGLAY